MNTKTAGTLIILPTCRDHQQSHLNFIHGWIKVYRIPFNILVTNESTFIVHKALLDEDLPQPVNVAVYTFGFKCTNHHQRKLKLTKVTAYIV